MNKILQTRQIIKRVADKTDTALLFYSAGGKDSTAMLDLITPYFKHVIAVFGYVIKGFKHIQPYLDWCRRYPNVEVQQVEHPYRINLLAEGVFCNPNSEYKFIKYGDWERQVKAKIGCEYSFSGMKGVDGYMKRMRLKMYAKDNYTFKNMTYPLALWTNKEVLHYCNSRNLIKPFVYGNSVIANKQVSQGMALTQHILIFLYKYYKSDYDMIIKEFPYAEKLVYDFCNGKYY